MAKQASSVVVEQCHNPRFVEPHNADSVPAEHRAKYSFDQPYIYRVLETRNTLVVDVGQLLSKGETQVLIDNGTSVTVKPTSKR